MLDIKTELAAHLRFREQLLNDYPEVAEEDLADTIAGATNLEEALAAAIRQAHADECDVEKLEKMMGQLKERANRKQHRADMLRARVASAMEEAGLRKLSAPDFTASLRPTQPKVIVVDETAIPEDYWKPQPPKLDKTLIKKAIGDGYAVPGATMSNGSVALQVRHG